MNIILPKINIKIERWKYNKDYEIYVSTLGNFKDKNKNTLPLKIHGGKGYIMIPTPHGIKAAHRLVMLTFRPNKNASELTVDHLDHNKRNNSLSNLEWVSVKENLQRAQRDLFEEEHNSNRDKNKLQITAKGQFFNSINEAVEWLIIEKLIMPNSSILKLKKGIKHSIRTQKPYCNIQWDLV